MHVYLKVIKDDMKQYNGDQIIYVNYKALVDFQDAHSLLINAADEKHNYKPYETQNTYTSDDETIKVNYKSLKTLIIEHEILLKSNYN